MGAREGAKRAQALPPDKAVGSGLPPPSTGLEARLACGGVARGRRNAAGAQLRRRGGVVVGQIWKIQWTTRRIPIASVEFYPNVVVLR